VTTPSSKKKFAVVGNPIAHSRSPAIHAQFAMQTGIALDYDTICSPLDEFTATVEGFFNAGGNGLNITLPFKEQAWALAADGLSPRARLAGAVNTLWMEAGVLQGCNTDGVGLLADIRRLGFEPAGKSILLVGAGGAAKGVVYPLLDAGCVALRVVNRSPQRALALCDEARQHLPQFSERISAGALSEASGFWDIVINATSSSLSSQAPALPGARFANRSLAYDMFYAPQPTAFMAAAGEQGASHTADGLGMLVAQAAASFEIWNGVRPQIEPVLQLLRQQLKTG